MTLLMTTLRSPALLAFVAACTGVALFSVMDAVMKQLVLDIGVYDALLWRNLIGVLLGGLIYGLSRTGWPSRAAMRLHIWRGLIVAAMAMLFFWSLAHLPLAEAIALSFIAPLIALYLAAVLLDEQIGRAAIIASLLGLCGVVVIMAGRIGTGGHSDQALLGVLAVLGSAVLFAYNLILARQQALIAKPGEIAFFQSLTVFLTLALIAPLVVAAYHGGSMVLNGGFEALDMTNPYAAAIIIPPASAWPLLCVAAALAVTSLLLLSWAYARAEAQILIPVEYTAFVWAALLGWFVFDEAVTLTTLGGTLLIVTGCLIAARAKPTPMQVEEAVI